MSLMSRIRRLLWQDTPAGKDAAQAERADQAQQTDQQQPEQVDEADRADPAQVQEGAPGETRTARTAQPSPQEQELRSRLEAIQTRPGTSVDEERVEQLASLLVADGRVRTAAQLLRRITALAPSARLRLLLAETLHNLKEFSEAMDLLEQVARPRGTGQPDAALSLRAHFLLGDIHGSEGNNTAALSHYEAVLALDFNFPRARGRADELRRRLDRPVATAAPTIFGAEDLGAGGRFLLHREIGRGGGGTVYLAQDQSLGRQVAVKVLHPHVARRQEARIHLFCEARIAAALRHPRIVTIYDLEESLNLVVMEYCAGGALADRIVPDVPMAPGPALRRLVEITSVLDTVHRCGVIHRDLKPGNLLLRSARDADPLVLTDFGTAHAGELEQATEQAAAGSLIYMAPEQRSNTMSDPRADLYACGVILLEMLLGRPPLSHQQAIAAVHLDQLDEPWQQLSDSLPAGIARPLTGLCRDLVHPLVDRRPADAEEVTRRALALITQCEELELRRGVLDRLRQRGAPPQWVAELERTMGL